MRDVAMRSVAALSAESAQLYFVGYSPMVRLLCVFWCLSRRLGLGLSVLGFRFQGSGFRFVSRLLESAPWLLR